MKTLKEIKEQGWNALVEKLGVSGATMFIMEHEEGEGNYTEDRKEYLKDKTLKDIVSEIEADKSK